MHTIRVPGAPEGACADARARLAPPRKTARNLAAAALLSVSFSALLTGNGRAEEAGDIAALRAEMEAMRREYDAKIDALEKRLENAESAAVAVAPPLSPRLADAPGPNPAPGPQPASGPQLATAPQPAGGPQLRPGPQLASGPQPATIPQGSGPVAAATRSAVGANVYNPGISVVLNGSYAAFERDPELARIPGFVLGEEAGLDPRGFSLGESEIVLNANVDHRIYGNLIFALNDEGEAEVEEAYIQTTSLPGGFTLKGGKFFSGIGYLNEKHAHYWDFIDPPLPYRVFLGNQYGDPGLQLRWIAPTDFYLEAGGEIFRGDAFPSGGAADHGSGAMAGFVQAGGDIGSSSSWLAKASYLRTKAVERDTDGDIFTGVDNIGIISAVFKWAPQGNPTRRNLILNGEYFFGNEEGDFNGEAINLNRSGWYAQAVYQFRPRMRIGVRYAAVGTEEIPVALLGSSLDDLGLTPDAISAMLEYDTSEFSRIRLMYTFDDTDVLSNNQLIARYTVIFGPHGAHRF